MAPTRQLLSCWSFWATHTAVRMYVFPRGVPLRELAQRVHVLLIRWLCPVTGRGTYGGRLSSGMSGWFEALKPVAHVPEGGDVALDRDQWFVRLRSYICEVAVEGLWLKISFLQRAKLITQGYPSRESTGPRRNP